MKELPYSRELVKIMGETINRVDRIAKLTAEIYTGKDWHKLNVKEIKLVELLEKGGYIKPNNPENGFVGKVIE